MRFLSKLFIFCSLSIVGIDAHASFDPVDPEEVFEETYQEYDFFDYMVDVCKLQAYDASGDCKAEVEAAADEANMEAWYDCLDSYINDGSLGDGEYGDVSDPSQTVIDMCNEDMKGNYPYNDREDVDREVQAICDPELQSDLAACEAYWGS